MHSVNPPPPLLQHVQSLRIVVCFFIWTQATCHAELEAINECVRRGTLERLRGCDLFVTCEPCIMCAQALRIIGIGHVYYGCRNPRFGGNGSVVAVHSAPFVSFSVPFFCILSSRQSAHQDAMRVQWTCG